MSFNGKPKATASAPTRRQRANQEHRRLRLAVKRISRWMRSRLTWFLSSPMTSATETLVATGRRRCRRPTSIDLPNKAVGLQTLIRYRLSARRRRPIQRLPRVDRLPVPYSGHINSRR